MNQQTGIEKNGNAQAAVLSAMVGVLTLALVNLGTDISDAFKETVHTIGKLWMPGAQGIGPYSGKETISLLAWLISWWIFHHLLKGKEWNGRLVISIFLIGLAVATTLIWPPVFTAMAHAVKGH